MRRNDLTIVIAGEDHEAWCSLSGRAVSLTTMQISFELFTHRQLINTHRLSADDVRTDCCRL